jgi:hypothetical protein
MSYVQSSTSQDQIHLLIVRPVHIRFVFLSLAILKPQPLPFISALLKDSVTVEDLTEAVRVEMLNSNGIITTMGVERLLKDAFGLNPGISTKCKDNCVKLSKHHGNSTVTVGQRLGFNY